MNQGLISKNKTSIVVNNITILISVKYHDCDLFVECKFFSINLFPQNKPQ